MLGRAGDVLNILPALQRHRESTGEIPLLLVGKDFAPILDGVAYAEPLIWEQPWQDCLKAIEWARKRYPSATIVNASVFGFDYHPVNRMASFDREAWDRSGADVPWGRIPLLFNRRDVQREAELLNKVLTRCAVKNGEPFVLTALSGHSSPFPEAEKVRVALVAAGIKLVDISATRADRIYDLLALYERASCLVAIDSAALHLAAAAPRLPVVMLTMGNKAKWYRSSWRPQHMARIYYSKAAEDPESIVREVQNVMANREPFKLVHVYSVNGSANDETKRREAVARQSWDEEIAWSKRWMELPIAESENPRDARALGDPKPMPFARDLINTAAAQCELADAIVISNSDVGISPGITGWLIEELAQHGAAFTHRWDFPKPVIAPFNSEQRVCEGRWYPGSDLFAFTKQWWQKWGPRLPDVIMGREAVDLCLRHLIKIGGGTEVPGAVWHEKHPTLWESSEHQRTLAGNVHNRELATVFLREIGGSWLDGIELRPGAQGPAAKPKRAVAAVGNPVIRSEISRSHAPAWIAWLQHLRVRQASGLIVGIHQGESAEFFLDNILIEQGSMADCIDDFDTPGAELAAQSRLARFYNIAIHKARSQDALRAMRTESYDFVYLNKSRTTPGVLRDAVLSFDLLKTDGVMIFADYRWTGAPNELDRPKAGIDSFLKCQMGKYDRLPVADDQLAIRKKASAT